MRLPFFLRRPWLIVRGTFANRDSPDLAALRAIEDSETFVWAVLPHAARSFATSILVLPKNDAWAAAIAYLQCRILDTYEDLLPDSIERPRVLRTVGSRWRHDDRSPPPPIEPGLATSPRDNAHLLLIEKIERVDAAYATLDPEARRSIDELVGNMADGMAWAAETFTAQAGVLTDEAQRVRYCNYVIGEPALYALRSLLHVPPTDERRSDALDVSVFIQLANVTRDIEKDLARGVAYDASLKPYLGAAELDDAARETVAAVRTDLMREALERFPAYARLVNGLPTGLSQARGAASLMLGFTDRYYAGCAMKAGHSGWRRRPRILLYVDGILSSLSTRWSTRVVDRTRRNFAEFLAETA